MKKIVNVLCLMTALSLSSFAQRSFAQENQPSQQQKNYNNPTEQELCDYINNKIAGRLDSSYLDKAAELEEKYPNAAGYPNPCALSGVQTLWEQVDELVTAIYGRDINSPNQDDFDKPNTHTSASDFSCGFFIWRWKLALSEEQDDSLNFPVGMPKHVVLLDETKKETRKKWGREPAMLVDSYYGGILPFYDIQVPVSAIENEVK